MTLELAESYPVLPLRDIVVFPHMIVPLFVGRDKSVRALEQVMNQDKFYSVLNVTLLKMIRLRMEFMILAFWLMCCNCSNCLMAP